MLREVIAFCSQHPSIQVRCQVGSWKLDIDGQMRFFVIGAWFTVALKGIEVSRQLSETFAHIIRHDQRADDASNWSTIRELLRDVNNFAFWPNANATDIQRRLVDEGPIVMRRDGLSEERLATWKEYSTRWVEHGINAAASIVLP